MSAHPAEPSAGHDFLPRDLEDFTGRDEELAAILRVRPPDGGRPPVVAVEGMAGVGKTALTVRAAHRLAARYPDAQLFVDLHGYSDGYLPLDPAAALGALLAELGVPAHRMPDDLPGRSAMWRAELAGRRVLVVVDNAADAGHVAPLLPDGGELLLLVTSRRRLDGLEATLTVELDVLPEPAAVALFHQAAGTGDAREDRAAAEVVRLCGYLPVAVRIAAARRRQRPSWTVAQLADRLRDEHRRLTELASTDRSVVASFVLSHRQLARLPRRLFRLLGLVPGPDVDEYAAAALAGVPLAEVRAALEDLVDAHLLLRRRPGRYSFHDLLRQHARRTARLEESEADLHAATTRLLDYYLFTAAAAADHIMRNRRAGAIDVTHSPRYAPRFADHVEAVDWLIAERVNLMAAINHAAHHDWPTHAWQLAHALWWFFHLRGYTTDLVATQSVALAAVHSHAATADPRGEATVLTNLGGAFAQSGLPAEAVPLLERALRLHRAHGDELSTAASLLNLSGAYYRLGADAEAIDRGYQAREVYRSLGDEWGQVTALNNVAIAYNQAGEPGSALARLTEALEIRARLGPAPGLARAIGNYGWSLVLLGRPADALTYLAEALELNRRSGSKWDEGSILSDMGVAYARLGEFATAFAHHDQALAMIRPMAQRGIEGEMRNRAGETYELAGRHADALDHYERALSLATQAGERYHQARAHHGLGRCHQALGAPARARHHWSAALDLYTELDHRDADAVRDLLAGT
ncbi:MAG TPA: tetratricopeptide repeat protein [Pseudonocardiaceae bacterium]